MQLLNVNIKLDQIGYFLLRKNGIKDRIYFTYCDGCRSIMPEYVSKIKQEKHYCKKKCQPAWNKGRKYNEIEKSKMNMSGLSYGRAWNKGLENPYRDETLLKMSLAQIGRIGSRASNWQGGISRAYKTGYNSPEYKEWRRAVFERDNYTCQKCGKHSSELPYITAHHIKSFSKFPSLRFDIDNGITVCEDCHCKLDRYRARFKKNKEEKNV